MMLKEITKDLDSYMDEFLKKVNLEVKDIFILGCSTSEVLGEGIGKGSSLEVGETIVNLLRTRLDKYGLYMGVQCCEHLNRAIVVEKETADFYRLEILRAVPSLKAGGGAATAAYRLFSNPVIVEFITAKAGIDIGDTEIGMHIRHVQIPVRIEIKNIGSARITGLSSRPKLIGGERTVYR